MSVVIDLEIGTHIGSMSRKKSVLGVPVDRKRSGGGSWLQHLRECKAAKLLKGQRKSDVLKRASVSYHSLSPEETIALKVKLGQNCCTSVFLVLVTELNL